MKKSNFLLVILIVFLAFAAACTPAEPGPQAQNKTVAPVTVTSPPGPGPQAQAKTSTPVSQKAQSQKCFRGSWPEAVTIWELQVCQAWNKYTKEYDVTNKYGADLVAAMMKATGAKEDFVSSLGAVGLLQIMPSDNKGAEYKCINGPCFVNRPTTKELQNGAFNLEFGVKMLVADLKTRGFDSVLTNWGGKVFAEKVMEFLGGVPK